MLWNDWMSARAWNPWHELQRLQTEMNLVFEDVDRPRSSEFPPIDVWSGEAGSRIQAEMPGFEREDIEISVVGDTLTLKGSRASEALKEGDTWHREERATGKFTRTLELPFQIEADAVKASYKSGVLDIELPRAASERPRKIAVTHA